MSSKTTHTLAGLVTGALLAYVSKSTPTDMAFLFAGAVMGASAPDWMEIPVWVTKRHWFSANESQRHSLIPHRTITHTLSLWVIALAFCLYRFGWFGSAEPSRLGLVCFAFCVSGIGHLMLDGQTPMGIPLLPFGRRYRFLNRSPYHFF